MTYKNAIFWFRQDLRVIDNPGLFELSKKYRIFPIYIQDNDSAGDFKMGEASRWWLQNSLLSLNKSLDNKLGVYSGNSLEVILKIIKENNIEAVYWNRCYEPFRIRDDSKIKSTLIDMGIDCQSFNGSLLWEPWEIKKKDGEAYKVYTPFYKHGCLNAKAPRSPLDKPQDIQLFKDVRMDEFDFLPKVKWYKKLENQWKIGEVAARDKLVEFLDNSLAGYAENRNYPAKKGISKLSPHLHFGEISPNQVWYSVQTAKMMNSINDGVESFLNEIAWREFSYYLLYHFPLLPSKNFQSKFDNFPWQNDLKLLNAWKMGQTGYPIVDAGMRELWQTGFMHNRVRMIVGSFLVKNLLIHWRYGEDWFWDCLVDADLASNSASWQWVAGCGADAAPYFRIFNPVRQAQKFDPDGEYIRRFVPELAKLPNKYLSSPWEAPSYILKEAGIILGNNYPLPIISIEDSRDEAMRGYRSL
jgi:deoxyribodipyrimidine photo-lyase